MTLRRWYVSLIASSVCIRAVRSATAVSVAPRGSTFITFGRWFVRGWLGGFCHERCQVRQQTGGGVAVRRPVPTAGDDRWNSFDDGRPEEGPFAGLVHEVELEPCAP